MSEPSYQTLKSLAKLLRAFKGMSFEEYQCLEMPYSCLIWSDGLEWNVELVLMEKDDDSLLIAFSAQEMEEAHWSNLFSRPLEVSRTLRITQSPVTTELALSPQFQSLVKQYKDMRETLLRFHLRAIHALESIEAAWRHAEVEEVEFDENKLDRFQELAGLILDHYTHMQELEQDYIKLSKTSGLALRLPNIEEEGQAQTLSIKLKQFLSSDIAQQAGFDPSVCLQLLATLPLTLL